MLHKKIRVQSITNRSFGFCDLNFNSRWFWYSEPLLIAVSCESELISCHWEFQIQDAYQSLASETFVWTVANKTFYENIFQLISMNSNDFISKMSDDAIWVSLKDEIYMWKGNSSSIDSSSKLHAWKLLSRCEKVFFWVILRKSFRRSTERDEKFHW